MKITKYGMATVIDGRRVGEYWYETEEKARRAAGGTKLADYFHREYIGQKEVDLFCEGCDKDLKPGDDYIKIDEDTRYCSDCYEENTFTYYTIGGDQVGDENNVEAFDEWDKEAELEEENEKA